MSFIEILFAIVRALFLIFAVSFGSGGEWGLCRVFDLFVERVEIKWTIFIAGGWLF